MRKYIFLAGALALLLAGCGTSAPDQTEALTSIAAYPETMHLTVGSHEGIQVVLTPSDASEQELVWASSNKAVATVDEAGMVSALSQGTCTVTVASKAYSTVSCHVEVIVGEDGTSDAADNSGDASEEAEVSYVEETNAAAVYPTYYLSEREVAAMDGEQIQFIITQIYAKNGYVFQTGSIQSYFSRMPWYVAVSNDASRLQMSSLDRSNLNLLVRYRDSGAQETSSLGWIWTRHAVDQALTEDYIRNLSRYDVQLLINTIYAKNGYIFETDTLQMMFQGQPWYHGWTRETDQLEFSSLDQQNLRLLTAYR